MRPAKMQQTRRGKVGKRVRKVTIADYVVEQIFAGATPMRLDARLAVTKGGGKQLPGLVKAMGSFSGFTAQRVPPLSREEYEIWDCEIIILPKRIYRDGPYKGWSIEDVLTAHFGGDMGKRFSFCEKVAPWPR